MKSKLYTLLILILFTSCSTIDISERDVFDAHRTITPQEYAVEGYSLNETTLNTDDGEEINSWILEYEQPRATILYLGGNGFLMVKSKPLIDMFSQLSVNVVFIDYRGYGKSSGEPTVEGVQKDAEVAYKLAREISDDTNTNLIVHGHSMGSFLASHIADTREVSGYILESPISEVTSWTNGLVPWLLRPFIRFNIDETVAVQNNLERVKRIDKPLLIVGGDSDDITPFKMSEELFENAISTQKELIKIEGGNHNNLPLSRHYFVAFNEFINSL